MSVSPLVSRVCPALLASLVSLLGCGSSEVTDDPAPVDVVAPSDEQALAVGEVHWINGRPWRLVWHDEFDGPELDRGKWQFDVTRPGSGATNNELQFYTDNRRENLRLENGQLVIEARRDWFRDNEYSSARIKTLHKASWQYGKFEALVKVPGGRGTWAAFWMYPDDMRRPWPDAGEIDILEHVGMDERHVTQVSHSAAFNWMRGNRPGGVVEVNDAAWTYHMYGVEWFPDHMDWFIDNRLTFTSYNNNQGDDAWPFNKPFHLLLNLAVGGDWGGQRGIDPDIWPRQMRVDWVRVWQL